ncbi:hypothetical protein FXO38_36498 [Capsicum annuum]|nr:hypothetical protein FXO38_36498 [Capsicum annuum]
MVSLVRAAIRAATRIGARSGGQQSSESPGTIGRSKGAAMASSHQQISVTIATEFVRWNEEAVSRCTLFSSQTYRIVPNACLICLYRLLQLLLTCFRSNYFGIRAEAAAAAGESSFRSFMVSVQCCGSSVAIVQQYFANSIFRLLLSVDGAHAASCEEMAIAMSSAEGAAYKGLQQCIETVMAESCRIPFKGA